MFKLTTCALAVKRRSRTTRFFSTLLFGLLLACVPTSPAKASDRGISKNIKTTKTITQQAASVGLEEYDPSRFHALIIGINDYQEWDDLEAPRDDAESVAEVLQEFYGFGHVKLLLDDQATRKNILDALYDLRETLTENDSLLIYYAGHGHQEGGSDLGYWIPHDASKEERRTDSFISNTVITEDFLKRFKVKHLLVVADSCFSGLMRRGQNDQKALLGLAARYVKPSRMILTSGATEPVPDDAGNNHSPFNNRFLQYLKFGDKPIFSTSELHHYIKDNLKETTSLMMPLDTPTHMPGGEFVFLRKGAGIEELNAAMGKALTTLKPESVKGNDLEMQPMEDFNSPDTLAFLLTEPSSSTLEIAGKTYKLGEDTWLDIPKGKHPFTLKVAGSPRTIYGVFEVLVVNEQSAGASFGLGASADDVFFKERHIKAALKGRPVRYRIGLGNEIVAQYSLSLRKLF